MNFLKKVFFGANKEQKSEIKKTEDSKKEEESDIPFEVLLELFEKSAKYIAESSKQQSDENKLVIYGLYKQATVGDCNTQKPSMLDFVGKSKWTAWNDNKGMSKAQAMKSYISKAVQIDPQIQTKMQSFLEDGKQSENNNNQSQQKQKPKSAPPSGIGMKMVDQKDYSETYSNSYFKLIEKNLPIDQINRQILLQINNNPKCYALHFAIDKQRVDLVKKFLGILSIQEIQSMKDEDGTGIKEYAQLIENQQIIDLINNKLRQQN